MSDEVVQITEILSQTDAVVLLAIIMLGVVVVFGLLGGLVLRAFGQYLEASTQTRASIAASMEATNGVLRSLKDQGERHGDTLIRVHDATRDSKHAIDDMHKAITDGFGDTSKQVAALKDDLKEQMGPVIAKLDDLRDEMRKAQEAYEVRERRIEKAREGNEQERKEAFRQINDELARVRSDFRTQFDRLMTALTTTKEEDAPEKEGAEV